jgi:hypothetical protein
MQIIEPSLNALEGSMRRFTLSCALHARQAVEPPQGGTQGPIRLLMYVAHILEQLHPFPLAFFFAHVRHGDFSSLIA